MRPRLRPLLAVLSTLGLSASAFAVGIASGPMVGAPEMRATELWVQTDGPAEVRFIYWPENQPDQRAVTPAVQASQGNAYAVSAEAGPLTPGTVYQYAVLIDGKEVKPAHDAHFRTTPFYTDRSPAPDFTVALGGGNRVNDAPYDPLNRIPGDGYNIFLAILAKQPDLMLWLGNNVNLREADQGSRAGMLARYSHNRAQPELQPLLAAVPQVAVWSEGETGEGVDIYGRNLADARECFELFWANPPTRADTGIATELRYADATFFLLDDRSFRDVADDNSRNREILGEDQIQWLRQRLRACPSTFKIVVLGSPALNPADSPRHLTTAKDERDQWLEALKKDKIGGLLFVSGGKNFGELTKMVRANAPDLYEVTVGPLTDRPADRTRELNFYRVPNTAAFERQFALLKFHGPEDNRQVTISLCNTNGEEIWAHTLSAGDMDFE